MTPPRALEREARLVTLRLFEDDLEYLKLTYSTNYNVIVRSLVARHVRKLKTKTIENLDLSEKLSKEELENV